MESPNYSIKTIMKDELEKESLLERLGDTNRKLMEKVQGFDEVEINVIPFANSWTAAQVADHLTKSNNSITKAMLLGGTTINRNPQARVEELEKVFLDFDSKLKSPDFILPSRDIYEKEVVVNNLKWSAEKLMEVSHQSELSEMINHRAFGDITKFEILYFVHFHTLRHTHQLDKIFEAVKSR